MKLASPLRRWAAVSALLGGVCSVAACGSSGQEQSAAPVPASTTTVSTTVDSSPAAGLDDGVPPVTPLSVASLSERLDVAVESGDACAVWDVARTAVPDLARPVTVKRFYGSIAEHLRASERFVPRSITGPWSVATDAADEEARRGGAAGVAFDSPEVRRALDALDSACPPK